MCLKLYYYTPNYYILKYNKDEKIYKRAAGVSWNIVNRKEIFILFSISGFTEDLIAFAKGKDN